MHDIILSLDQLMTSSIQANKYGNKTQALKYFKKFEDKKNEAIELAKQAAKDGNVKLVDEILGCLNKLKNYYKTNLPIETKEENKHRLEEIFAIYNQGNFEKTISIIESKLKENNQNPNLYNLLALSFFNVGEIDHALSAFNSGLKMFPDNFNLNNNVSIFYKEIKNFDKAIEFGFKALEINPKSDEATSNIGSILLEIGNYDKALLYFKKSISLNPHNSITIFNFAVCNLKLNNYKLADEAINLALRHQPDNYEFLNLKGQILREMGRHDASEEFFYKALDLNPNSVMTLNNLGLLLQDKVKYKKSLDIFKKALRIEPNNVNFLCNIANSYLHIDDNKEAIKYLDKCLSINPNFDRAFSFKGVIYAHLGQKEKSIKSFQNAIKINIFNAEAYRQLSRLYNFKPNDPLIRQMEKIYGNELLMAEQKAILSFALGKSYEDLKEYSKSFNFYKNGNDFYKNKYRPQIIPEEVFCKNLAKTSIHIDPNKKLQKYDLKPIFVLGLPRSGTSLIEQILSSHSKVEGMGELDLLSKFIEGNLITYKEGFSPIIKKYGKEEQLNLSDCYMGSIKTIDSSTKYFVDKMPHNFRWISYILNSHLSAKVILVERNPMDNCFSLFKMLFSARRQHSYSFDLEILGKYYLIYKDLVNHWKEMYKNNIYICKYEKLISDPETEIKKLSEYCDLKWEDKVMKFYETKRSVNTASHSQVRQKLYSSSIGSWKNYENELEPLKKIIN